eukprot:GHVS01094923.1.p1 GENE.GHVS01094923.1~~GHVS01094923.1.p1  ORF type:complete len:367 (+),score=61.51 GHVS01094923.1:25-1125(+)
MRVEGNPLLPEPGSSSTGEGDVHTLKFFCAALPSVSYAELKQWLKNQAKGEKFSIIRLEKANDHATLCYKGHLNVDGDRLKEEDVFCNEEEYKRLRKKRKAEDAQGQAFHLPALVDVLNQQKQQKRKGAEVDVRMKVTPLSCYSYPDQLIMKEQFVKTCLRRLARSLGLSPSVVMSKGKEEASEVTKGLIEMFPIIGSEKGIPRLGYRNKCEFAIAPSAGGSAEVGFVCGRSPSGETKVASPYQCVHTPTAMKEFIFRLKKVVISRSGLAAYSRASKTGFWRSVMLRLAGDDEMMAVVQITSFDMLENDRLTELLVDGLVRPSSSSLPDSWMVSPSLIVGRHCGLRRSLSRHKSVRTAACWPFGLF